MPIFSAPYAAIALSIIAIGLGGYLFWNIRSLNRLRKTFFAGQSAGDLETLLYTLHNELKDLREGQMVLDRDLTALNKQLNFAVQKVGLVRFNPFDDGGGNFSFSLALLNSHNSGVIITSLHGREQNRIYSKRITAGKGESQLTEEEVRAMELANSETSNFEEAAVTKKETGGRKLKSKT